MSDYNTVKAGEPSPSGRDEYACGQRAYGYVCTRSTGHEGQHVAEAGRTVAQVWDAVPNPELRFMGVDITDDMVIAFVRHYRKLQQAGRL